MAKPTGRAIRDELVEAARILIQTRGIGEFSYGALAESVGIKSPSIHHHFPKKEQLIAEVASQYREEFNERVLAIDAESPSARIIAFSELYADTARQGRTCLCGAVASEWASVGSEARKEVSAFFDEQVSWLQDQLRQAQKSGEIRKKGIAVDKVARIIFSALQGSLVLSRSNVDFAATASIVRETLKALAPSATV
jgi:TetR/AcrR family transcriptional regulator, transcriptional repressor for nem operon